MRFPDKSVPPGNPRFDVHKYNQRDCPGPGYVLASLQRDQLRPLGCLLCLRGADGLRPWERPRPEFLRGFLGVILPPGLWRPLAVVFSIVSLLGLSLFWGIR